MTPNATPQTAESRINILLTGIHGSLNDTLMILSVNPVDDSVVMLSFPRDISNFPLYDGRTFGGKINSLMSWARNHPTDMPDGPFPTLVNELGYLLGVPIHYYAAINLNGFVKVIDDVGGVTVDNPRAINDPLYDWLDGTHGFTLPAGKVKLTGRTALAYARSRQGAGDSDFTRAARQQQLLVALRNEADLARHAAQAAHAHPGRRRQRANQPANGSSRPVHRAGSQGGHQVHQAVRARTALFDPPTELRDRWHLHPEAPDGQARRTVDQAVWLGQPVRWRVMVRHRLRLLRLTLLLGDALAAAGLFVLVSMYRHGDGWADAWLRAGGPWWMWAAAYGVLWAGAEWIQELDQLRSRWTFRGEVADILRAAFLLAVSVFSLLFLVHAPEVSRLLLVILFASQVVFSIVQRRALRLALRLVSERGISARNLLVLGSGSEARSVARLMERQPALGYRVIGHLGRPSARCQVLGPLEAIETILHEGVVDEVVAAFGDDEVNYLEPVVALCQQEGKRLRVVLRPGLGAVSGGRVETVGGHEILTDLERARSLARAADQARSWTSWSRPSLSLCCHRSWL